MSLITFLASNDKLWSQTFEHIEITKLKFELSLEDWVIINRISERLKIQRYKNSKSELIKQSDIQRNIRINKINNTMENLVEQSLKSMTFLWEYLKEDNPDIQKVEEFMILSYKDIEKTTQFWRKNPEINNFNLKSKLVYCIFIKDILHKKEKGDTILADFYKRIRKNIIQQTNITNINIDSISTFSLNPSPICMIKSSQGKISIISCNKQFSIMLNKTKFELENKSLKIILKRFSHSFYRKIFLQNNINGQLVAF